MILCGKKPEQPCSVGIHRYSRKYEEKPSLNNAFLFRGESNAVVYSNSVIGARTEKYAGKKLLFRMKSNSIIEHTISSAKQITLIFLLRLWVLVSSSCF